MKKTNSSINNVFIMPKISPKYLNRAKKSELKVLYFIFMSDGKIDIDAICNFTEESVENVNAALAFWRCAGVIGDDSNEDDCDKNEKTVKKSSKPVKKDETSENNAALHAKTNNTSYSLKELTDIRDRDKTFASLVAYFEKISGHLYNATEQEIILYLYDTLGVDYEVIMGIAQYCASLGKCSIRYIKQTVENISEDGVKTYDELVSYLESKKNSNDYREEIKAIIGAKNRAFSKSELSYISTWQNVYKSSVDLIAHAYEKTISRINKPQISYMSKILENWYQNGLTTPKEVEEHFSSGKDTPSSHDRLDFNMDDIFETPEQI